MNLPRPKSLLTAFLAVIFPLTLILAAILFLAIQTNEHNKDHQFLQNKLNDILATHSSVLALPVWNLDDKRVQIIIEAISKDPDVRGIAVFDKRHSLYGAIGVFNGMTYEESEEWSGRHVEWEIGIGSVIDHLGHTAGIGEHQFEHIASRVKLIFQTDAGPVEVGDLFMAISYENLGNQFLSRVILNASVSLFALLTVALSILIAYRQTVGIPLARLLRVITDAQSNVDDEDAELNLNSVGEVDRVIEAFHTLQSMQAELEKNLREARSSLEQKVEERTTALAQSKKELKESEKKYRELFENIIDISYQTDAEGNFVLISPSVEKLFGYTPEELIGKNITDFYRNPGKREELLHQLKQKRIVENFEAEIKKKDGSCAWVSTNARLLLDEEGNFLGVEGVTRNITQLKKAEEEKENLEAQLQQAQKMESIGTLAGGIAHDFNNILSAIIGNAEIAQYDITEQNPARFCTDQIIQAGYRATDLVKQILAFSRQTEQELKLIKISSIVKEALKLLRPSLPSTIQITQQITAKKDTIMADPTHIHQVLMNLCTNAMHSMFPEGGSLEVSLNDVDLDSETALSYQGLVPGSYIKLIVSDTGHGMEREVMERIFDPYFTTKEKGEGTGLGLAVVHGIVKSHGGAITVHSEPGKGTTFNILLPLMESDVELRSVASKPDLKGNERIMFVDDEKTLVNLGKRMLQKLGYEVETRTSSIEALEAFRSQPERYDLIITDLTMPNMTGDKLAKELLRIRPDIPIILCTGFSEIITESRAKGIGIKAFIMKPIVKAEIAETIREVLDQD